MFLALVFFSARSDSHLPIANVDYMAGMIMHKWLSPKRPEPNTFVVGQEKISLLVNRKVSCSVRQY